MRKHVIAALTLGSAILIADMPLARAENSYTPPPLFGAAPIKIAPVPVHPTVPNSARTDAALKDAARLSERVETPVIETAPINTETLLEHPADRVAEKAQTIIKTKSVKPIPDFIAYGTPIASKLSDGTKPAPRPKPRPIITTIQNDKPNILVLSRDPETGKFKRSDNKDQVVKRESRTTSIHHEAVPPKPQNPVEKTSLGIVDTTDLTPIENALALADAQRDHPEQKEIETLAISEAMSDQLLASSDTSLRANNAPALPLALSGPPSDKLLGNQHVLLLFSPGLSDLTPDVIGAIDENLLPKLNGNPNLRLEIRAYASASDDGQSTDRRISLARGLAVREHLRKNGIDANRMDVRALGQNTDRKPYDRVDVIVLQNGAPL